MDRRRRQRPTETGQVGEDEAGLGADRGHHRAARTATLVPATSRPKWYATTDLKAASRLPAGRRSGEFPRTCDRTGRAGRDSLSLAGQENGLSGVTLDFGVTKHAYAEGMMQIVAHVDQLRRAGMRFDLVLPNDKGLAGVFSALNWAHFINPAMHDRSTYHGDAQLPVLRYTTPDEQTHVVDQAMEVVERRSDPNGAQQEVALHQMRLPRSHLTGLEWALNEISDNVLNHAQAPNGGLVQVVAQREQRRIQFVVADGGRGVYESMHEGHPHLRNDREAIGDAIRRGVTRNQDEGQGNGLAGALRIAAHAGGTFLIASRSEEFRVEPTNDGYGYQTRSERRGGARMFSGTFVFVEVRTDRSLDLAVAFDFGKIADASWDYLDKLRGEAGDFTVAVAKEAVGFGTRGAGRALRNKLNNLLDADDEAVVNLDWKGVPLVSSSFADEAIGTLFVELGPLRFAGRVHNRNIDPVVGELINRAIVQRAAQGLA